MKLLKTVIIITTLTLFMACECKNCKNEASDSGTVTASDVYRAGKSVTEGDINILHNASVKFREEANLCGNLEPNFFELDLSQAKDVLFAMNLINHSADSVGLTPPVAYRLIYGKFPDPTGDDVVKLIVVGLDASTGNDREAQYIPFSQLIKGYLPCPTKCDVNVSEIASKGGECTLTE